ncbi:hypothetical protein RGQ29_029250 [Quercus rubra]|uniref:Amino acid transporter transmembrane domain-containing protein n=1 Tax=Quercus rubra TaxID=3512 RepID=A0AAN7IN64_QUERU|nr:hypothetical protein RGQ29_029250 [Quercus rubra]
MLPRSHTLPCKIHHGAVEERHDIRHYLQVESNYSKCFDDDGRLKRTGTFWTATTHNTAVIGSGVRSLIWAIAQLGWVAGLAVLILFALVNIYTSNLLAHCYRAGDPVAGQRNYTYMDVVKANLGVRKVMLCGLIQYLNLFGIAIGYTIAASVSMMAILRSNCFHKSGGKDPCHMFLFPQIPNFDQVWWLSIVAAIISFTYSSVGLGLGLGKVAESGKFKGSLMGISIGTLTKVGTVTTTQKMWRSLQALGAIDFAYSFSIILIEIQHKTMKKATLFSITVITVFYLLCGCIGYASFGDLPPGNLLTGFGFYNPYWLLDIANIAIVVHLLGAYQVFCQPLFAFIEKWCAKKWPKSDFVTAEYDIPIPFFGIYQLNLFRAFGFWPLTVFFPIEMYISQKKIAPWTSRWVGLQIISVSRLFIFIAAAVGSFAGLVLDLKIYNPFKTSN